MARKVRQIVRRGAVPGLVRVYNGRDRETNAEEFVPRLRTATLRHRRHSCAEMYPLAFQREACAKR